MNMTPWPSNPYRILSFIALFLPICVMAQVVPRSRVTSVNHERLETRTVATVAPCSGAQNGEQSREQEREAIQRLPENARFWLTEDVAYIISREERCAFLVLKTDQERDQFIEQFWSRRAPDPKSLNNSLKQQHYERIAFADRKFATRVPGFRTDRGRIYIAYGPPDSIESHPGEDKIGGPPEHGTQPDQYPWEIWDYRHVEGVGDNVELRFVDSTASGDYRLSMPPGMTDELIYAPPFPEQPSRRELVSTPSNKIEIYVGPSPTPVVQFKDLEAMAVARINRAQVPFTNSIEFQRATHATTLAVISIQIPSGQPGSVHNSANGPASFEIFGRISRPSGWVIDTFERSGTLETSDNSEYRQLNLKFMVPIAPGRYRLALVVKKMNSGETGSLFAEIWIPAYDEIKIVKSAGQ